MSDDHNTQFRDRRRAAFIVGQSGDAATARRLLVALATDYPEKNNVSDECAGELARLGYVDEAIDILEAALNRGGERPFLLSRLVQIATDAQRWTDASAALRRWLALVWDANVALKLGHSLIMSGALGEAEAVLRTAVAADPTIAMAQVQLATVLAKRGKAMDALAAADAALALAAKAPTHCLRGDILMAMSQPILAAMAYQRALDVAPSYEPALAGLTEAKSRQQKPQRVLAYGQRVLVKNPAGGTQYLAASWSGETGFRQ